MTPVVPSKINRLAALLERPVQRVRKLYVNTFLMAEKPTIALSVATNRMNCPNCNAKLSIFSESFKYKACIECGSRLVFSGHNSIHFSVFILFLLELPLLVSVNFNWIITTFIFLVAALANYGASWKLFFKVGIAS